MTGNQGSHFSEGLVRSAALALVAGTVTAPFSAAHAGIVVDDTDQNFSTSGATLQLGGTTEFTIGTSGVVTGAGTNMLLATGGTAYKLSAGTVINGNLFSADGSAGSANLGQVYKSGNYYIGLVIDAGNGFDYYGWAEIASDTTGGIFDPATDILAYAFETDANVQILAGQTSDIPEPGSLAMLAAGAIGALEIRRRARAQSGAGRAFS